jgi:hypothetical protein
VLTGQLTQPPQLRPQPHGPPRWTLLLAVPRQTPTGTPEPGVTYIPILATSPGAEHPTKRRKPGDRLEIHGMLHTERDHRTPARVTHTILAAHINPLP